MTASWAVIAIVREPWPVIERFVSWHLAAGAEQIHLVFDDPDDPAIARLAPLSQVVSYPATEAFWAACECRPDERFTHRQNRAMRYVYRQIACDWVLQLDGDELLHCADGRFGERLAAQPQEVRSLLIEVAEHVGRARGQNVDLFRRPLWERLCQRVYGEFAPYLVDNHGLVGHTIGKSVMRSGQPCLRLHPHWLVAPDGARIQDGTLGPDQGVTLLHFYVRSFRDWRRKIGYRNLARSRNRRTLVMEETARLLELGDETRLREFYRRLHRLDGRQAALLRRRGRLLELELNWSALSPDVQEAPKPAAAPTVPEAP